MEYDTVDRDPNARKSGDPTSFDPNKIPKIVDGDGDTPGPNHKEDIGRTYASAQLAGGKGVAVVDIRTPLEYIGGVLPGALLMPRDRVKDQLSKLPTDKSFAIIVYDQTGEHGSVDVAQWLREQGYTRARRLQGGFASGSNTVSPSNKPISPKEPKRELVILPASLTIGKAGYWRSSNPDHILATLFGWSPEKWWAHSKTMNWMVRSIFNGPMRLVGLTLVSFWTQVSWAKPAVWQNTPSQIPGAVPAVSKSALSIGRSRYLEGDLQGAIAVLTPWLESRRVPPFGRERVAGHLLLGTIHMELEKLNLASSHFYQVRKTESPLASYGAWFEALTDHKRGRHYVAIKECKEYRNTWPNGPEADECLLLTGMLILPKEIETQVLRHTVPTCSAIGHPTQRRNSRGYRHGRGGRKSPEGYRGTSQSGSSPHLSINRFGGARRTQTAR